eukprot:195364-Chlamydomonas_euryale.AAC.2
MVAAPHRQCGMSAQWGSCAMVAAPHRQCGTVAVWHVGTQCAATTLTPSLAQPLLSYLPLLSYSPLPFLSLGCACLPDACEGTAPLPSFLPGV